MKTKIALVVVTIALLSTAVLADVKITTKKQIYKRPKPQMDFKKTFTINWPVVKAATPAVSRKIEAALSYEKNFDFTIRQEMRDIQWLEEATYSVIYNKGDILCVYLSIEGSGAYPDSSDRWIVVNSKTGMKQTPAMVFKDLSVLAAMVKQDQRIEVAEAIKEMKKDPDLQDPDPSTLFTDTDFHSSELKAFSVDEKGVTFHYDYGFPHVIQAAQPAGVFTYTWAQMKPHLKAGGLLASMGR